MTRPEAVEIARAAGLQFPRVMPHKGRDGTVWHLYYGPVDYRRTIVLPVNVDKKRLEKAIEQANGQNNG